MGLCHKTSEMHFPDMGCSTSECIKWDAVATDRDGVCEKQNPLQGLTLKGITWWNGDLCTTSRTENGCQRGCERMEIFDKLLVTPRNRTLATTVGGRDCNHLTTHEWCFRNYSCFCKPVRAEDVVKLSSKLRDKNGRENQRKTWWVGSGRHNENGIGCGKREWWEKFL